MTDLTGSLSPVDETRLRTLVSARTGLDLRLADHADLERAVQRACAAAGAADAGALCDLVAAGGAAATDELIAELTVGETYFFRNTPLMLALEHRILPDLCSRRAGTRRLRLWSAGCSSGEEAYSLAAIALQVTPPGFAVEVLGTDINRFALDRARQARYGRWSFRGTRPPWTRACFVERDGRTQVVPRLRERVRFEYLNLVDDAYPSLLTDTVARDLIVCANVLLYFDDSTARVVLGRLRRSLPADGVLVVGPTEWTLPPEAGFVPRRLGDVTVFAPAPALHRQPPHPPHPPPPPPPPAPPALPAATGVDLDLRPPGARPPASGTGPATTEPAALTAAWACANLMRLDEALDRLDEALAADPLSAPAHYLRGLVLIEADRPADARDALRRCTFLDPGHALAHVALSELAARAGDLLRARRSRDQAARIVVGQPANEALPGGGGMTAGRLAELLAAEHRPGERSRVAARPAAQQQEGRT